MSVPSYLVEYKRHAELVQYIKANMDPLWLHFVICGNDQTQAIV